MFTFALILLIVGLFHALAPRTAWFLSIGWKLKDVEPSEGYIVFNRVAGTAGAIFGVIAIIVMLVTTTFRQSQWVNHFETEMRPSQVLSVSISSFPTNQPLSTQDVQTVLSIVKKVSLEPVQPERQGYLPRELVFEFTDGSRATIFDLGASEYEVSFSNFSPDYTFRSPDLGSWWDNVLSLNPENGPGTQTAP